MNNRNSNECPWKIDAPYPPVRVDGPNPLYACEMLGNMSDVVSEMSDISRYFYASVVTRQDSEYIAQCFHSISIVEMHHLNIFAELALQLGADPRLWHGRTQKCWWSPSFICYPGDLCGIITESIRAEEAAINKYSNQANTIRDMNIVANLNRIIRDEERHIQIFEEMYKLV